MADEVLAKFETVMGGVEAKSAPIASGCGRAHHDQTCKIRRPKREEWILLLWREKATLLRIGGLFFVTNVVQIHMHQSSKDPPPPPKKLAQTKR